MWERQLHTESRTSLKSAGSHRIGSWSTLCGQARHTRIECQSKAEPGGVVQSVSHQRLSPSFIDECNTMDASGHVYYLMRGGRAGGRAVCARHLVERPLVRRRVVRIDDRVASLLPAAAPCQRGGPERAPARLAVSAAAIHAPRALIAHQSSSRNGQIGGGCWKHRCGVCPHIPAHRSRRRIAAGCGGRRFLSAVLRLCTRLRIVSGGTRNRLVAYYWCSMTWHTITLG